MLIPIFPLVLFLTFIILAGIHFNWAFGGTWGFEAAIPTNENGEKLMNPGKMASLVVGVGLFGFGVFYLLKTNWFETALPSTIEYYITWIIPIIFILRAIGDFKYAGFFKKEKSTKFANADSKIFSPLCLGIGLLGLALIAS